MTIYVRIIILEIFIQIDVVCSENRVYIGEYVANGKTRHKIFPANSRNRKLVNDGVACTATIYATSNYNISISHGMTINGKIKQHGFVKR